MLTKLKINIDKVQARSLAQRQVEVDVYDQVLKQIYRELAKRVWILAHNPVRLKLMRVLGEPI